MDRPDKGEVWEIQSRNLLVGVYVPDKEGFIGIRTKFDSRYLFMEYHWDTGPPYGTARQIRFLEQAPDDLDLVEAYQEEKYWRLNKALFDYLEGVEQRYELGR